MKFLKSWKGQVCLLIIVLLIIGCFIYYFQINSFAATGTYIVLNNNSIKVDNNTISTNTSNSVYLTTNIESNDDLSSDLANIQNKVVNITKGGTYYISGEITDGQIAINVSDTESVNIILNGVSIACRTAPAIIVYNAYDSQTSGIAGVNFYLADDTINNISGVHIPKNATYTLNGESKSYSAKYDAAISSDVSISFNGNGILNLSSDNEGIETKMHFTINDNGTYNIKSYDDAINASEDNVSVITINGGTLNCSIASEASEGDAIDSNGYIYINNGILNVFASATSQDSCLDSDLGVTINGGTITGTGNMYDEILDSSLQNFIYLQFANQLSSNSTILIKDSEDKTIVEYTTDRTVTNFLYSSQDLLDGNYIVYVNGTQQWDGTTSTFKVNSSSHNFENVTDNGNNVTSSNSRGEMMEQPTNQKTTISNNSSKLLGIILLAVGIIVLIIIILILNKKNKKI